MLWVFQSRILFIIVIIIYCFTDQFTYTCTDILIRRNLHPHVKILHFQLLDEGKKTLTYYGKTSNLWQLHTIAG